MMNATIYRFIWVLFALGSIATATHALAGDVSTLSAAQIKTKEAQIDQKIEARVRPGSGCG